MHRVPFAILLVAGMTWAGPTWAKSTQCRLQFDLHSWSVLYKSGKGTGAITCDNGQRANVKIRAHGGGVSFGKSNIEDGHGTFSRVEAITALYGSYASSEAHAGAAKSAGAHAMWNGDVSLTLSGKGKGWDLGFAFGSFKISPR
ncbi:MAG: hypothetical protein HY696_03775 [Deltaproteobacteria bacterium]|nr:hypothetical protein [Deltaproteobacteria bacterium]